VQFAVVASHNGADVVMTGAVEVAFVGVTLSEGVSVGEVLDIGAAVKVGVGSTGIVELGTADVGAVVLVIIGGGAVELFTEVGNDVDGSEETTVVDTAVAVDDDVTMIVVTGIEVVPSTCVVGAAVVVVGATAIVVDAVIGTDVVVVGTIVAVVIGATAVEVEKTVVVLATNVVVFAGCVDAGVEVGSRVVGAVVLVADIVVVLEGAAVAEKAVVVAIGVVLFNVGADVGAMVAVVMEVEKVVELGAPVVVVEDEFVGPAVVFNALHVTINKHATTQKTRKLIMGIHIRPPLCYTATPIHQKVEMNQPLGNVAEKH
jgi:hypothetical protein